MALELTLASSDSVGWRRHFLDEVVQIYVCLSFPVDASITVYASDEGSAAENKGAGSALTPHGPQRPV
jgi:hypothetical protein